jgi:hypothetical protein
VADYLTRLVERTLQLYPTVRPDIPPTFAPEKGGPLLREAPEVSAPYRYSTPRTTVPGEAPEERYSAPHSTAGDTSRQTSDAGESAVIEPRPAGDETPRGPGEPRRRPAAPATPVSDEAMEQHSREPEAPEIVPDRREGKQGESPTGTPETIGYTRTRTEIRGRSVGSANARLEVPPGDHAPPSPGQPSSESEPGRSEGGFRDETSFTMPPRRRETDSSRAATPHDEAVLDRRERSVRERPAGPDHPFSDTVRLDEHAHPSESSSPETDAPGYPTRAPGRAKQDSPSRRLRRPVSEAPGEPVAGRQRGAQPPEPVAPGRPGITERTPPQTVQVTIGRVEVRAIPPAPAQPLPESKPVPGLSLDDYLRRYNGARR